MTLFTEILLDIFLAVWIVLLVTVILGGVRIKRW